MAKFRFDQIAINSTKKKKPIEEDKHTYLGLENLDSGTLKVSRFGNKIAPIGEKLIMKKGDVLFGKRRAYQKKVAIAPFDGIFSAHGMVLRPNVKVVDPVFFPLFISSDYFLDNAIKISVGSLSPTINWGSLKQLEFELPDLVTQKKIANILWAIINTMESYKELIGILEELATIEFNSFLEKQDKVDLKNIKDLVQWLPKSNIPASKGEESGLYPFFTSGLNHKWLDDYIYDDECIILGNGGSATVNYYNGKFSTTSHGFVFKSKRENFMTKYLYMFLSHNIEILEHGFRGVGLKNISKTYINNIEIPLIDINKQTEIINKIDQIETSKKKLIFSYDSLSRLYKKMIDKKICKKED